MTYCSGVCPTLNQSAVSFSPKIVGLKTKEVEDTKSPKSSFGDVTHLSSGNKGKSPGAFYNIAPMDKAKASKVKASDEQTKVDEEPETKRYVPTAKQAKLVDTETTIKTLAKLARSVRLSENVLLIGPTGGGKTSYVKYLAYLTNNELRRVNLHDMTDVVQLIGGYKPLPPKSEEVVSDEGKSGASLKHERRPRFEWVDGIIVEAMKKGQWLLLDEINLAEPAILERLNSLLDDDRYIVLTEKNNEIVRAHPNFRLFATMNPAFYSGRKELSDAMMNRFHKVWVGDLKANEIVEILKAKSNLDDVTLLQMSMFHKHIADMAEHRQIGKKDGPYPFTLRDTLKWIKRIKGFQDGEKNLKKLAWREARELYESRFASAADRAAVEDMLRVTFDAKNEPPASKYEIEKVGEDKIRFAEAVLPINPKGGSFVPKTKLTETESTRKKLCKIAKCVAMDEPALLVGLTAAGKTSLVKYLGKLTNNNVHRFNLSMQTDITEFIGGYVPGNNGEYVWKDGILVEAMKNGDWVIFDEINLADPAILEAINSLLDPDRSIVLTDKRNEVVRAHPNFRIFATMNPATSRYAGRKELSLAMRNRFTEMWIEEITDAGELKEIVSSWLGKVPQGDQIAQRMVDMHKEIREMTENRKIGANIRNGYVFTIRELLAWSKYIKEFHEDEGLEKSFINGAIHCYGDQMAHEEDFQKVEALAIKYSNLRNQDATKDKQDVQGEDKQ